jgi:hypothetical protein
MHLISALAAGVTGAESGTATVKKRGTSTDATWYTSFEGDGASTGAVTLDSNGGATVYVDELVTVVASTAAGSAVRTFTAGQAASGIEVRSDSFTGTDYETAISAAGSPTTLQAVLDAWKTSAGAVDFNVLIGSTATTMQAFASFASGLIYNVKDTSYAATGDGSTDDSTAIQAAIDAAEAAGGGIIYFPAGTYRIEAGLTVTESMTLLGAGADVSAIEVAAALVGVTGTATAGSYLSIHGLGIVPEADSQASGGAVLTTTTKLIVTACNFGTSALTWADNYAAPVSGGAVFRDCDFYSRGGAVIASSTGRVLVDACKFIVLETSGAGNVYCCEATGSSSMDFSNCITDFSSWTSGAGDIDFLESDSTGNVSISGLTLDTLSNGGGVVTLLTQSGTLASLNIRNLAGVPYNSNDFVSFTSAPTQAVLADLPTYTVADNSASITFYPTAADTVVLTRSDATALAVDLNRYDGFVGQVFTLVVYNSSGGTSVDLSGTAIKQVTTPVAVAAGATRVFRFLKANYDATESWVEIGTSADTP